MKSAPHDILICQSLQIPLDLLGHSDQVKEQVSWQPVYIADLFLILDPTQNWQPFSILSKWVGLALPSKIYDAFKIKRSPLVWARCSNFSFPLKEYFKVL